MDETSIKIKGQWYYLYRAVDKTGQTIDFLLTEHRDEQATKRFLTKAIRRHGVPEKITIDGSPANAAAIKSDHEEHGTAITIRKIKYLNNIVEIVFTQMTKTRGLAAGSCTCSLRINTGRCFRAVDMLPSHRGRDTPIRSEGSDDYPSAALSLLAATPKFEVKRHGASSPSNDCMPVPPGSYSASNFAGAAYCHETDIVRHGKSPEGKQRYRCRQCLEGDGRTFLLAYAYAGQSPAIKQQIVDMAMNASGIRDTARVLHISPTTVIKE